VLTDLAHAKAEKIEFEDQTGRRHVEAVLDEVQVYRDRTGMALLADP
jgi:hypothetical protein